MMPVSFPDLDTRLRLALAEDLGRGDVTTQATVPPSAAGQAEFLLKSPGVPSGYAAAARVFALLDPSLTVSWATQEGEAYPAGTVLGTVSGPLQPLLAGERLALNLLQRASGVATRTRQYGEVLAGSQARLLDTRKTNPLWRDLDKQAVRHGGGLNHRAGLDDGILIKDNHIAAVGSVAEAVRRARGSGYLLKVECEVTIPAELQEALAAGADRVLLDNMPLATLRECVALRDALAPQVSLEASGNVTLDTLAAIAETGVDFISSGALTHSAPALDISLNITAGELA
ncbi:carboxylating nicotinate-nucleotide diphosphorylase [Deinococcus lacus]|uniref:nicotinate-nucleotide diphosphorylase (carboxylating) n=1 Tax=Deinococcus lacus TaxID=392561 RepID=A0ABW1YG61_9DEIO